MNALILAEAAAISRSQKSLDEVARNYARAATFFAGMHPDSRYRKLAAPYGKKARDLLSLTQSNNGIMDVQRSETLVILNQRCGEYAAMQGEFADASKLLQYAIWGSRFMHFEHVRWESQVLILCVHFFQGDLAYCNTVASELLVEVQNMKMNCLGARFMALCGEHAMASQMLAKWARVRYVSETGKQKASSSVVKTNTLWSGLTQLNDVNAWLALSLILWRDRGEAKLAVSAALKAIDVVTRSNFSAVPLNMFHAVALCFTVLWDPIRSDPLKAIPETLMERRRVQASLGKLVTIVRCYAIIYKVCQPHAMYCISIRYFIVHSMGLINNPSASRISIDSNPKFRKPVARKGDQQFLTCAALANELGLSWLHGLALLEVERGPKYWMLARDIYSNSKHTKYEYERAKELLIKAGFIYDSKSGDFSIPVKGNSHSHSNDNSKMEIGSNVGSSSKVELGSVVNTATISRKDSNS